jgi:hypothetical protein
MPVNKTILRIHIEAEDIDLISKGLHLGKRYIEEHRSETGTVDEYQLVQVDNILEAMERYWNV